MGTLPSQHRSKHQSILLSKVSQRSHLPTTTKAKTCKVYTCAPTSSRSDSLSLSLSLSRSVCLPFFFYNSISLSVGRSGSLCLSVSVSLSICLPVHIPIYIKKYGPLSLSLTLSKTRFLSRSVARTLSLLLSSPSLSGSPKPSPSLPLSDVLCLWDAQSDSLSLYGSLQISTPGRVNLLVDLPQSLHSESNPIAKRPIHLMFDDDP